MAETIDTAASAAAPAPAPAAAPAAPAPTAPAALAPTPAPTPAAPAPTAPAPAPAAPPASAAPPPATPPKTAADPSPEPDPKVPAPADWPDDWREKLAGDDKKALARLQRMTSPHDVLNSWRAMEQRMSSGEFRRALPNNPTEEEVAEYRKSNGIPDKPEDYDVNLGNGFVWGETDKPLLDSYTKHALENNMPPAAVKANLAWFAAQEQAIRDDMAQRDENHRVTTTDALRAMWGNNFTPNMTAMRNLFEGKSLQDSDGKAVSAFDLLMSSRAVDGRRLGNIPGVLEMFSGVSRDLNPFATLVPDSSSTPMQTADARLGELNRLMADKRSAYWRGPSADAFQKEWRDLYEAKEKAKARVA